MALALLVVDSGSTATGAPLSPEARALVASVAQSIDQVRARHALLPPPRDDADRLTRMGELDQAPRRIIVAADFSKIPEEERPAARDAAGALIEAVDRENQVALSKLVPAEGWFLRSRYGEAAARSAFHIVQHADNEMQRRFLSILEPLVAMGEVDGQSYGMMFDRIAVGEGRSQRFGSQFRCDQGRWAPYPLENPEGVEGRRAAMGFPGSFADMKLRFAAMPPCAPTRSARPAAMDRKP
ncbi:MAG: hypothetical protein Q8Q88_20855 [Phenylobacterium sp.]|uniref:DUF6624 domain-containing protein n=1 Tax=Phenylobacterium sp. TaxID=1871053 RepID=UPI00273516DD|nr:DUF6624 domain-containing protein [Phenylobacterium sp.]MDP3749492.1 hypothetical protein [Phenylobacterium sp.]